MSEHRPPVRRRRVRLALAAAVGLLGLIPLTTVTVALGGNSRIRYVVDGDRLSIETGDLLQPGRTLALDGVTAVESVRLARGRRLFGTGLPGYCVGRFSYDGVGTVWQATDCSASAVLLRVRDQKWPVVLTPADPAGFTEALRDRTSLEARPVTPPRRATAWRWAIAGILALALGAIVLSVALFLAGPETMRYRIGGGELEVATLLGERRWSLAGATARPHRVRLGLRLWGAGLPGYHTGLYLADGVRTRVYATQSEGVLVEGTARVFVSPAEVEPFLAALAQEGARLHR